MEVRPTPHAPSMLIVVGGHTRNIGKTSVVCGIVRALPQFNWTAVKITQYGHGICSRAGEACECSDPVHPVAISEERGADPSTDSGRFLASGASRAFWVRTAIGNLVDAVPGVRRLIGQSSNVIIESNSILRFLKPDLCAMVLDGRIPDFKETSLRFLDRAHALVLTSDCPLDWPHVPASRLLGKPRFLAPAPDYESSDLILTIRRTALNLPAVPADQANR